MEVGDTAGLEACATALPSLSALKFVNIQATGLLHHSDRGVQSAGGEHRALLAAAGLEPSMSLTGNPYDNAAMESFLATSKRECVGLAEAAGGYATRAYAAQHVHADVETRNVGDVRDFVRLYRFTGQAEHLEQARRLFRELRTRLSTGDLFDQGGKPLEADLPYIEEDKVGLQHGFAKPYIIGYALAGLPELAHLTPDEPKLRDVVRAVADFLADNQDPVGGWRYPHPRSSWMRLGHAMEQAWQLAQADRLLGPQERHLDAIERVLRQRLHTWRKTGKLDARALCLRPARCLDGNAEELSPIRIPSEAEQPRREGTGE